MLQKSKEKVQKRAKLSEEPAVTTVSSAPPTTSATAPPALSKAHSLLTFYGTNACNIHNASDPNVALDTFGNVIGDSYDLANNGAFSDYSVLVKGSYRTILNASDFGGSPFREPE